MQIFRPRLEQNSAAPHAGARALSLLLEGAALHAVEDADAGKEPFQASIRKLASQAEDVGGEQLLTLVREIIDALRAYNQHVEEAVSQREADWRGLCLSLLNTNTLLRTAVASPVQIGDLRSEVSSVTRIRDLRKIRTRIAVHLRSAGSMNALRSRHAADSESDLSPAEIDPLTGLPDRVAAERIMTRLLAENTAFYPVVVVVEKLESINSRFGFKSGDRLLLLISQHLANSLPKDDVFRWRGGSFLLLLKRAETADHVRFELQRLNLHRKEYTVELESRSVELTVTCTWQLLPVGQQTLPENIVMAADDFMARNNPRIAQDARGRTEAPRAAVRAAR